MLTLAALILRVLWSDPQAQMHVHMLKTYERRTGVRSVICLDGAGHRPNRKARLRLIALRMTLTFNRDLLERKVHTTEFADTAKVAESFLGPLGGALRAHLACRWLGTPEGVTSRLISVLRTSPSGISRGRDGQSRSCGL